MRSFIPIFVFAALNLLQCAVASAQLVKSSSLWQGAASQPTSLVQIVDDQFLFKFHKLPGQDVRLSATNFQRYGAWNDVARGAQVLLVDGSVLVGDVLKITEEHLVLGDAAGLGRCRFEGTKLPLAAIRGVVYQPAAARKQRDQQFLELRNYKTTADSIQLIGGETLSGLLLGSREQGPADNDGTLPPLRFQLIGQTTAIDILPTRINSLACNVALTQPAPEKPAFWLGLNDGNWLAVKSLKAGEREVDIELAAGMHLRTPIITDDEFTPQFFQAVTYLESLAAPVTYLSDLKPTRFESVPLLTIHWPLQNDLNVQGGRLRTTTSIARKGIGMHAKSIVEYQVPADAAWFQAELAVDAIANQRGSLQGVVWVRQTHDDPWKQIAQTKTIRTGDLPEPIQVPLQNTSHIRLETLTADDGDSGDLANWMFARFIPTSED